MLRVKDLDEAIRLVNTMGTPLMTYLFSTSRKAADRVKMQVKSGSFMANDTVLSLLMDGLPFGGTSSSGMGSYHGRQSFLAFSHAKGCLERGLSLGWLDERVRFPPYTQEKAQRLFWLLFRAPRMLKGAVFISLFVLLFGLLLAAVLAVFSGVHAN